MLGSRGAWTPAACALAFGASLVFAREAGAADKTGSSVEAIAVAYSADGACPGREQFLGAVRRYTSKWSEAEPDGNVRAFEVRFAANRGKVDGKLVVRTSDGRSSTREIGGPECDGVARAMAIIMAVAIDPHALAGGAASEEPTAEEPPTPPSDAPPPSEVIVATEPPRPDRPSPKPASRPPPKRKSPMQFGVEAGLELTSAVTGTAMPVASVGVEMRFDLGKSLPKWLVPSVAIGVRQSWPMETHVGEGSSESLWSAGALRLCPARFVVGRFELAPCAEVDVGVLVVEARGIVDARRTAAVWVDRGGSLRATFHLGERWAIGAGAGISAPITRNRYTLANGDFVSQAPAVGVTGGVFGVLGL